jgi:hypothetical protein
MGMCSACTAADRSVVPSVEMEDQRKSKSQHLDQSVRVRKIIHPLLDDLRSRLEVNQDSVGRDLVCTPVASAETISGSTVSQSIN